MYMMSGLVCQTALRSWGEPEAAQLLLASVRLPLQPLSLPVVIDRLFALRRRGAVGSAQLPHLFLRTQVPYVVANSSPGPPQGLPSCYCQFHLFPKGLSRPNLNVLFTLNKMLPNVSNRLLQT